MKGLLLGAALLLTLCACAPAKQALLAEQALCVPIGLKGEVQELCVLNIQNPQQNYQFNTFYLITEGNISDVAGLGGGFETYELLVSPARRYLVEVEDGGEGHPFFSVLDLDDIRNGVKPRVITSIEAYPSGFYDLHWQGEALAFTTETDLLPAEGQIGDFDQEYSWRYLFHPDSGRLEQLGEPEPLTIE